MDKTRWDPTYFTLCAGYRSVEFSTLQNDQKILGKNSIHNQHQTGRITSAQLLRSAGYPYVEDKDVPSTRFSFVKKSVAQTLCFYGANKERLFE